MTQRTLWLTLTLLLALPQGADARIRDPYARAPLHTARFYMTPATRANAALLSDDMTVLMVVRNAPKDLERRILAGLPRDMEVRLRPMPHGLGTEVYLTSRHFVSDVRLKARRGALELTYREETAAATLRQHIGEPLPPEVPSAFVVDRIRPGEAALRKGDLSRARRAYEKMLSTFALQSWAALRLADVTLLERRLEAACEQYHEVAKANEQRIAGLMARIRLFSVGCDDVSAEEIGIPHVLTGIKKMDGRVGRFLWQEALWAMSQATEMDDIFFGLAYVKPSRHTRARNLVAYRRSLLGRMIRLERDPYLTAVNLSTYADELRRHPEAGDLLLLATDAHVALDVPKLTAGVLEDFMRKAMQGGPLWRERMGEAQLQAELARAYELSMQFPKSERVAARYRKRFKRAPEMELPPEVDLTIADLPPAALFDDISHRIRALANAVKVTAARKGRR